MNDNPVVIVAAGALGRAAVHTLAASGDQVLAVTRRGRTDDLGPDVDDVRVEQDVTLGGAWWSCRTAAHRLTAGGGIVSVTSRAALTGGSGSAAYAVAKAGVIRLTSVLADQFADGRVRDNAVPSVLDTPANRAPLSPDTIRRAVPTDDVASVVAFLCSDAARTVTGAAVPAHGPSL